MLLPEARACCADLDVRPWDDHAIRDAVLAASTALLAASPQVTPVAGAPGMWWVGANGFDAVGGEAQLARTLLAIAQQWHPDARVAIADSCVAARAATWAPRAHRRTVREADPLVLPDGITIIPAGQCAQYLAPAPLGLVPMDEDLRDALQSLGLRTVGALASLDAGDIEKRWGPGGLTAWRLAHGHDPRRPGLVRVDAVRSATVELPAAVESTEPVLFVLRAQLQRLLRECVEDGRAAASVAITLVLDAGRQYPIDDIGSEMRGHVHVPETSDDTTTKEAGRRESGRRKEFPPASSSLTPSFLPPTPLAVAEHSAASLLSIPQRSITREVRPARPLARLEPLFDQCRSLLERWNIPAPIIGVTVSIPATAPLAADQGDLLIPSWRDAAMNADAVFARLRAVLDPDNTGTVVVHPEAGDSHRLEDTGRWISADAMALGAAPIPTPTPTPASAPASASTSPTPSTDAVLRLLDTPESVDVEAPHGAPDAVWWRGRRLSLGSADGPERLSGDWWRADAYARDYWRCVADGEGELLLYHEAGSQWYLQGWYD
jgi:nucleotidyltransferase/DNA polymerase involved in DNA repair